MRRNPYDVAMPYEGALKELAELQAQEKFDMRARNITERIGVLESKVDLIAEHLGMEFRDGLRLEKK